MTTEPININLTGVDPNVVHIHITHVDNTEVLTRLDSMENTMSDLSGASSDLAAAINDVVTRVDEDVAHLQDLLNQALAADAADQATIQQLRDQATAVILSLNESTNRLKGINPDPNFPAVPTPAPTPAPTPTPAAPVAPATPPADGTVVNPDLPPNR